MERVFAAIAALLLTFAVLAKGAHDVWAATLVYVFILSLTAVLVVRSTGAKSSAGLRLPLALPIITTIIVLALSYRTAARPAESYLEVMDWLMSFALLWAAVNWLMTDRSLDLLIKSMVPVVLVQVGVKIYQTMAYPEYEPWGTLINANLNAAFLLMWIPIFLDRALTRAPATPGRRFWWAISLAATLGLILSQSAIADLCLIVSLPILFFRERTVAWARRHPKVVALAGTALLGAVGLLAWYKLSQIYRWDWTAAHIARPTSRTEWWASALSMWKEHPWLGLGPGNFGSAYLAFKVGQGQHTLYAHSFPLTLLAELGLLGFAAVGAALGFWIRAFFQQPDRQRRWGFFVGANLFLLYSLINTSAELFVNLLCFWFLVGVTLAPGAGSRVQVRRSVAIIVVVLCISALPFLGSAFLASRYHMEGQSLLLPEDFSIERLDEAEDKFKSAIALQPSLAEAHAGLAAAHYLRFQARKRPEDLDSAIQDLRQASRLDRYQGAYALELGQRLKEAGRIEEAREIYRRALLLRPGSDRVKRELEKELGVSGNGESNPG